MEENENKFTSQSVARFSNGIDIHIRLHQCSGLVAANDFECSAVCSVLFLWWRTACSSRLFHLPCCGNMSTHWFYFHIHRCHSRPTANTLSHGTFSNFFLLTFSSPGTDSCACGRSCVLRSSIGIITMEMIKNWLFVCSVAHARRIDVPMNILYVVPLCDEMW